MKKLSIILSISLVLILSGCTNAYHKDDSEAQTTTQDVSYSQPNYIDETANKDYIGTDSSLIQDKKVIYTADLSIETKEYEKSSTTIENTVAKYDGYFVYSSTYTNGNNTRNGYYQIRIPADKFDAFMEEGKGFGNVTSTSVSAEDITDTYVDTQAHIDALKQQESRLLELMNQATTVDELIQIEAQLSDVRYQIESYETTIKNYDTLVEYCTVDIDLIEVSNLSDPSNSFLSKIGKAFQNSIAGVGVFFTSVLVFLIMALPYILIIALIVLIIIFIKKRRKEKYQDKK